MILRMLLPLAAAALVLTAWGWAGLSRFPDEPARPAGLAVLALGLCVEADALRVRFAAKREAKRQALFPIANILLGIGGAVFLPWQDAHPEAAPAVRWDAAGFRWAGVALLALGISVQAWSVRTLGRWFTPRVAIQEGHELIERGPYRALRHPFYTGLLLAMAGAPAVFASWLGFALTAAMLPLVAWRIRDEERLLEREFGERYRALRRRTWALLPFVW